MRALLLAVLLAACHPSPSTRLAAPVASHVDIPPPTVANINVHRWEYFCFNSPTQEQLNRAGHLGWELISSASDVQGNQYGTGSTYTFCFRRELAPIDTRAPGAADEPAAAIRRADLGDALADVRTQQHYEGRELRGLRLYGIAEGSFLADLGLAERDLVVRAGGRPITSADDLRAAVAGAAPTLNLEILRGQTPLTITVRFRD